MMKLLFQNRFYLNYNGFSRLQTELKIMPIFSSIDDNFSNLPNIEEFENLIAEEKTKAILICNPNNPTGYVYSKED